MSFSEWKTYRLGEAVVSANTGLDAIKKAPIVKEDTGVKCLRIQDISQRKDFQSWGFCNVNEANYQKFQLKKDDLIIARTGETVGVNRLIKENLKAVFNNGLIRIRVNENKLSPLFLYYSFQSNIFKSHIHAIAYGTSTQPNIRIEALLDFKIKVPEVKTQQFIVSILSSLDDKIELNRQTNQTLEAIAQTLFKEMCLPKVDVLPEGWRVGKLGEICEVNKNTINKKIDQFEWINYIEISEVNRGTVSNTSRYEFGMEPSRAKRKLKHGDVVLSTVRPDRGAYFLAINPLTTTIVSTGFAVFSATNVPFSFLYLFLTSEENLKYYGHVANGGAYPALNPSVIMDMSLAIPPKNILDSFHKIVEPVFFQLEQFQQEINTLSNLRDGLLPKLMKGEIAATPNTGVTQTQN